MKSFNMSNWKLNFFFVSLLIIPSGFQAPAQNAPYNLRCYDKINPVGTDDKPYFGWYMDDPDDNETQTAFQVLVASSLDNLNELEADIWNSGQVNSGMQNYLFYQGNPLSADFRYYWKVRIWDKDGNISPYSAVATFETGLLTNSDWSGAKWIKRDNNDNEDYTYFRKEFSLSDKTVQRATVYVTAVHDYELYLNGNLIGKGPAYHYPQYQYYNAFDITSALSSNTDQIFACLTHWYGGGQGRPTSARGFLLKAVIEYTDTTQLIIGTDSTWKQTQALAWRTGQTTRNGEGVGFVDRIDASQIIPDWNTKNYDDSEWSSAAEIGAHPVDPWTGQLQPNLTRVIEKEISPVSVTSLGNGTYLIDLGKVYAGVPKITFSGGTAGTVVSMRGGFTLKEDGTVSTSTDQETNMNYFFILDGGTSVFQPMVYLGMRYFQVSNSPNALNTENVKFICRHFELDPSRSSFHSSNDMLSLVWNLMKHSVTLGTQDSFVDTPTREKGGFLGDSWSIAVPAMTTMCDRTMNLRILLEFLDSQDQYWPDGRLNAVYPNVDGKRDIPDYTQMYLVWVWDYYMQTGNKEFLKENYNKLKKVADYVDTYRNESTGLIHKLAGGGGSYLYGIIDWPSQMRYGYDMAVESRTVVDAYAYIDFENIARIAEVLDSTADYDTYHQKALDMKDAINDKLINNRGVYIDGLNSDQTQSEHVSQHANMFPLAMGIIPAANLDSVITEIKEQKMSVGMVTLRWLPEAIGQADEGSHLIELYTNTEWDGWAKIISLGGTATWEAWDAITTGQSLSHPWGAVGLLGIQQYILGVKPLKPQHELIQVKPLEFNQKLRHASGILPTDRGDIAVSWERIDTIFSMTLNLPDNVKAEVYIPKSGTSGTAVKVNGVDTIGTEEGNYICVGEIGSGTYTFERAAVRQLPLKVDENVNENSSIKIYPNPTSGNALVDLGKEYPSVTIKVHDMIGSTIKEESYTNTQFCNVEFEAVKEGIFFVTITADNNEKVTMKLIKY
jgi:alpha-L-rhamnosidase